MFEFQLLSVTRVKFVGVARREPIRGKEINSVTRRVGTRLVERRLQAGVKKFVHTY